MDKFITKMRLKTFFNVVSLVGLVILVILVLQWGHRQNDTTAEIATQNQQIKSLTEQNNALSKQIATGNQDIKAHIDCIITFFGLPNRLQLSISDVCHFVPTPTSQSSSQPVTTNKSTSSSTQNSSTAGTSQGAGSSGAPSPSPSPTPPPAPPSPTMPAKQFVSMLVTGVLKLVP